MFASFVTHRKQQKKSIDNNLGLLYIMLYIPMMLYYANLQYSAEGLLSSIFQPQKL